eukprot:COSAG02_NODE_309_length_25051_cov_5.385460_12_plen_152_part_00
MTARVHGVSPSAEIVEIFENQRRPRLQSQHEDASPQGFHSATLLPIERKNFSDRNGDGELENPSERPDAMLPEGEGWQWDGEWALDTTDADSEGWQYAFEFVQIDPLQRLRGEDVKWYDGCDKEGTTWVRRRRWVRQAVNTRTMSAQATSA